MSLSPFPASESARSSTSCRTRDIAGCHLQYKMILKWITISQLLSPQCVFKKDCTVHLFHLAHKSQSCMGCYCFSFANSWNCLQKNFPEEVFLPSAPSDSLKHTCSCSTQCSSSATPVSSTSSCNCSAYSITYFC